MSANICKQPASESLSTLDNQTQPSQQLATLGTSVSWLKDGFTSFIPSFRWRPTSEKELENAEQSILSFIKRPFKQYFVNINNTFDNKPCKINTIELLTDSEIMKQNKDIKKNTQLLDTVDEAISNDKPKLTSEENTECIISHTHDHNELEQSNNKKTPLVMIHGFGAGLGFWILNLDPIAERLNRKVYALDLPGFARSTRSEFDLTELNTERQFVDSIEQWRKEVGLEKMILVGHSFGGYLCGHYALVNPKRVEHLFLVDPWGIAETKQVQINKSNFSLTWRIMARVLVQFNPLAALRASGPYGPGLLHKFRFDIGQKFVPILKDKSSIMLDYIYHCNAQKPTGEAAFRSLTIPFGIAKRPLLTQLLKLEPSITLTFIYGSQSWIVKDPGELFYNTFGAARVGNYVFEGATHHVYADKYDEFNKLVLSTCEKLA